MFSNTETNLMITRFDFSLLQSAGAVSVRGESTRQSTVRSVSSNKVDCLKDVNGWGGGGSFSLFLKRTKLFILNKI